MNNHNPIREILRNFVRKRYQFGIEDGRKEKFENEALSSIASEIEKLDTDPLDLNPEYANGYNQAISDIAKMIRGSIDIAKEAMGDK